MKVLYIGQFSLGTTSKMRADVLKDILDPKEFKIIDTHVPFFKTTRLFRSIGFRFKVGPLIHNINRYIQGSIKYSGFNFDLIWVDKGVFLHPSTVVLLKQKSDKLIHYTPDMAFYANKSGLFEKAMPLYDYLITTKSKELHFYQKIVKQDKIVLTTQGFSKEIHKSYHKFNEKDNAVAFVGLAEPYRFKVVEKILSNNIKLKLAGKGWGKLVEKHRDNSNLLFMGEGMFDDDYSKLISSSKFAIGLLSKRFPELHTTRTFEIPACGTVLLTEKNDETSTFFNEDEVIFYKDLDDMISKIEFYLARPNELREIADKGKKRVISDGRDYFSILKIISNKLNQ